MNLDVPESHKAASTLFESVLSHFQIAHRNGSHAQVRCPGHDDRVASLSITAAADRVLLKDHGGCETDAVLAAVGLEMKDLYEAREPLQAVRLVGTYDYRNAAGKLIYQTCRYEPKDFKQRRPDGRGGWINNLNGIERLLYRQPELLESSLDDWVLYPEGEKDCDNLVKLGFTATTNSEGAGKLKPHLAPLFKDRKVAPFVDKDKAGLIHARKVAALISPYAREVRIIEPLPAMPTKGDVSDLIAKGWDHAMIQRLIDRAPIYEIETARPMICESEHQYPVIKKAAWKALELSNRPPRLFDFFGVPIRLEDNNHRRVLTTHSLRDELATAADWIDKKFNPAWPSVDLANLLLAARIPFPPVKRFATSPFFAADGRLVSEQGYDEGSRTYLMTTCDIEVPEHPTDDDVRRSISLIDETIFDFPLVSRADRAAVYAMMVERAARELIDGALSGHLAGASRPGSGKGLLIKIVCKINNISPSPWPGANSGDEEEIRKALTTFFISALEIIYIDNLAKPLKSTILASAMTESHWKDRIIGTMRDVVLEIRNSWYLTANNLSLSAELLRRFSQIRLVPATEHFEERTDFRHPDILAWVTQNRAAILSAVLILIQKWIVQGKPRGTVPWGSYESWSEVIGGILTCAGVTGFLENRREIADQADTESASLRAFVAGWFEQFQEKSVLAKQLLPIAESIEDLSLGYEGDTGLERERSKNKTKSLGKLLRRQKDCVFAIKLKDDADTLELQIVQVGDHKNTILWGLRNVDIR